MIPGSSDPKAAFQARVGRVLNGKWRLDRLIDVGGMGAVYEAAHRNGRRAAIKILHPHYASNALVRERFLMEGYVANKIDHPGAVAILDDDVAEDGSPFLVMELLDGDSLSTLLSRAGGKLPVADALAIGGQVLEVLTFAHANGVIHRDIKPANVFVTRTGHAKLLDFGLARVRDGAPAHVPTAAGIVMGTAGYMAPEQARGQPDRVDSRTDVFAIGAVLFRSLTGRRIHEAEREFDLTIAAMVEPAPSLATVFPHAGSALVRAVDRALAFEREARWQTAREMFESLRAAYLELGARATLPTMPEAQFDSANLPEADTRSSLVVEIAFGDEHDPAILVERHRAREVGEALSGISKGLNGGRKPP
ncbi:MAG: serine/threonine-protein kinase [Polyangiaceae bacterium]